MTMGRADAHLPALRCACGAVYLYPHDTCPRCGGALVPVRVRSEARLVSHTTVRVNPTGVPYRLGVAVTHSGASTLCVVEGAVRGNGRDRVQLVLRDGRYHALGARSRVTRSPAPPSSDADSRKS